MKALRQVVVCVVTVGILLFGVTPEVLAASKTTSAVKVIKFKRSSPFVWCMKSL